VNQVTSKATTTLQSMAKSSLGFPWPEGTKARNVFWGNADLNGAGKLIAQNLVHKSAHILRPHFEKRMVVPVRRPRVKTEVGSEERVEIGDFATIFDFQSGSRLEDVSKSCGRLIRSLPNRSCQPCEIGSKFGCL
jgi:hypothetical protein